MAVYQATKFSSNPKRSYDNAVKLIDKYLKGTADKGLIYKPDSKKSLEVYVDADFAGRYNRAIAVEISNTPKMRPRTKHIGITYHHFRTHVAKGDIKILTIDTSEQEADF